MEAEKSVCRVDPGREAAVAAALGGKFLLETDCGFFGKCSHVIERFDLEGASYASWVVCATDPVRVAGAAAAGLVLVAVVVILIRRRARGVPV